MGKKKKGRCQTRRGGGVVWGRIRRGRVLVWGRTRRGGGRGVLVWGRTRRGGLLLLVSRILQCLLLLLLVSITVIFIFITSINQLTIALKSILVFL